MSETMRRMALALVCGVLALMGWVPAHASEDTPTGGWVLAETGAPVDVSGTPACEGEGQEYGPCLWDASVRGNGVGESFLVEEDGSVTYLRRAGGAASVTPVKKHKKEKKQEDSAPAAPAPSAPPAARAYPGWVWTGRTTPVTTPGLPACADVHGQETCIRQGYTLIVDQVACTQTIITDQGDQYVPGPAVAQALSDSCQAHKPDTRGHEDNAGWSGSRSVGGVHSASPSATVDSRVNTSASPSVGATVGSVGVHREVASAPAASVRESYDGAVVVVAGVLVVLGLGVAVWCERSGWLWGCVGRHGVGRCGRRGRR
jgi:hypothetical protein